MRGLPSPLAGLALALVIVIDLLLLQGSATSSLHIHTVVSPYQAGPVEIRVLTPDRMEPGVRYPVVLVLPVRPQHRQDKYGDGLLEVEKLNLHNRHRAIFAMPMLTAMPWYCDHASVASDRQESHIVDVVVPYLDRTYPTLGAPYGRHLLGFSKSGWGAWTLLLRNPDVFGRAAAWDAPFMKDSFGPTEQLCGTQENFASYMPSRLIMEKGPHLGDRVRLFMSGYDFHREHHSSMHGLLTGLKIPHKHIDGPRRKHDWHSGWLDEAAGFLFERP
jgi:hypothetical protein